MFSFAARKKTVDFQRFIRRLIDRTMPNSDLSNTQRQDNRHNRVIPALVCPLRDNTPILADVVIAITKDISDQGVGLIMSAPYRASDVVVGVFDPDLATQDPWFFRGRAQSNVAIGGGFWLLGIRLTEFMNDDWRVQLAPLFPLAEELRTATF
jgi:hypothetical protein